MMSKFKFPHPLSVSSNSRRNWNWFDERNYVYSSGSMTFDDLIRFDSVNGGNEVKEEDEDGTGAKRKSSPSSKPG